MHISSYNHMLDLVDRYLSVGKLVSVVDLGSFDVNGSYRQIFSSRCSGYIGLDVEKGPGVDIVLRSPYFFPIKSSSVDIVISGQAFEHVEFFWLTWLEMVRVLKCGGLLFLIAPSCGPEHRYPQDCWRFYPDGYRALAKLGNCDLLEVSIDWSPHADLESAHWGDCVGVFMKKPRSIISMLRESVYSLRVVLAHFKHLFCCVERYELYINVYFCV